MARTHQQVGSAVRRLGWLALGISLSAAGLEACRKPVPEELVYTGKRAGGSGGFGSAPQTIDAGPGPDGGVATYGARVSESIASLPFTKHNLLVSLAECAQAQYTHFEARAAALTEAARAHALEQTESNAAALRAAWTDAMLSWQVAEAFQFGPAGGSSAPGGMGLRSEIYAWPSFNRCKVDEQIVSGAYSSRTFGTSLIAGRGLGALEYLLNPTGAENGCSASSTINSKGTWAALGNDELSKRRAEYASAVAVDVHARAQELLAGWSTTGANFAERFVSAGRGSDLFPSEQEAFNTVNAALHYVDIVVKDMKLARPLGLSSDCPTESCPDRVESPYAGLSSEYLRANMVGFRLLFQGCGADYTGLGFEDYLRDVVPAGSPHVADRMLEAMAGIDTQLLAYAPLERAIHDDLDGASNVYYAVKRLTDMLKGDFRTVLNLELPGEMPTDND